MAGSDVVIWRLFSDADLMLLTTFSSESLANKIAGNLTRDLGDAGVHPGLAIRMADEACKLSWNDPVVFSSLAESRLLAGSLQLLLQVFSMPFRHRAMRRKNRLIREVVDARVTSDANGASPTICCVPMRNDLGALFVIFN